MRENPSRSDVFEILRQYTNTVYIYVYMYIDRERAAWFIMEFWDVVQHPLSGWAKTYLYCIKHYKKYICICVHIYIYIYR